MPAEWCLMVPEDLQQYTKLLGAHSGTRAPRILMLSPNHDQYHLFRRSFPTARLYASDRALWDLSKPRDWYFDVIFAANVMHYATHPALWFSNILRACSTFLVQDLISRQRSDLAPFLGPDGDSMRYKFTSRGVTSDFPDAFDLDHVGADCTLFESYLTSTGACHFIASFRGAGEGIGDGTMEQLHYLLAGILMKLLRTKQLLRGRG